MQAPHIAPLTLAALPAVAAQGPDAALLAHLRWCLCTPYATALGLFQGTTLAGVGTALAHTGSGWIGRLHVWPPHQGQGLGTTLVRALVDALEAVGAPTQRVCAPPEVAPFFHRHGFAPEGELLHFSGGTFHEATQAAVVAFAPEHLLGLLHLDRRATGEDRRRYVLEHLYLAHTYVEQGRVRGALLPLLGHGLVLADAPEVGFELLRWLLPVQPGAVVPAANAAACAHLHELGHRARAHAVRCVRGRPLPWHPERLFAAGCCA